MVLGRATSSRIGRNLSRSSYSYVYRPARDNSIAPTCFCRCVANFRFSLSIAIPLGSTCNRFARAEQRPHITLRKMVLDSAIPVAKATDAAAVIAALETAGVVVLDELYSLEQARAARSECGFSREAGGARRLSEKGPADACSLLIGCL